MKSSQDSSSTSPSGTVAASFAYRNGRRPACAEPDSRHRPTSIPSALRIGAILLRRQIMRAIPIARRGLRGQLGAARGHHVGAWAVAAGAGLFERLLRLAEPPGAVMG